MSSIIFLALAIFAVVGALAMVYLRHPMYSALGLLVSMLSVAGLFALLNATFLFMVQIIVYAGAIMTLILFIIMFLNIKEEQLPAEPKKNIFLGIGFVLMLPINYIVLKAVSNLPTTEISLLETDFGDIKPLGMELYRNWILPFEMISILLLVALIGAVVLAKKKKKDNV